MGTEAAALALDVQPAALIQPRRRLRRAVPRVNVYSRHTPNCKWAGKDRRIGCACSKQLVYYRDGKLHRISADTCDGEVAEAKARSMMSAFAAAAKGEPTPTPAVNSSYLIDELVKAFVAKKSADSVKRTTARQWNTELTRFATFLRDRGLVNIGDVRPDDVQVWRDGLKGSSAARRKSVMFVMAFFNYCVDFDKLVKSPAIKSQLRIKRDDVQTPKALDDVQFTKLLAALPKLNGRTTDEDRAKLKSLAILMRMTGLALKDAVCCERKVFELMPNGAYRMYLRRAKTGKAVHNYMSAETMAAVLAGANTSGKYLFIDALPQKENELNNLINYFGWRFIKLGEFANIRDEHDAPIKVGSHGFGRHSFVLMLLNADVPTHDIATLIGDTPSVVEQHYSEWIQARAARLETRMMGVLAVNPMKW
jgi:site-specific recombinase XerD